MSEITEQQLQAAAVAPRVTLEALEANITGEYYFNGDQAAFAGDNDAVREDHRRTLSLLTFCVLVLRNGFTVTGESACASPENFNAEIGRNLARKAAVGKIWPLMGYELRSRLANEGKP